MKRINALFISLFFLPVLLNAQVTLEPKVQYSSDSRVTINMVVCSEDITSIIIDATGFYRYYGLDAWTRISSQMALSYIDPKSGKTKKIYPERLCGGKEALSMNFDTRYTLSSFGKIPVWPAYGVDYPAIPYGVSEINLEEENTKRGWVWKGIKINPRIKYETPYVTRTEAGLEALIEDTDIALRGVYEPLSARDNDYQLAFLQADGKYYLIFVNSSLIL